jgi:hypothetical protein
MQDDRLCRTALAVLNSCARFSFDAAVIKKAALQSGFLF